MWIAALTLNSRGTDCTYGVSGSLLFWLIIWLLVTETPPKDGRLCENKEIRFKIDKYLKNFLNNPFQILHGSNTFVIPPTWIGMDPQWNIHCYPLLSTPISIKNYCFDVSWQNLITRTTLLMESGLKKYQTLLLNRNLWSFRWIINNNNWISIVWALGS